MFILCSRICCFKFQNNLFVDIIGIKVAIDVHISIWMTIQLVKEPPNFAGIIFSSYNRHSQLYFSSLKNYLWISVLIGTSKFHVCGVNIYLIVNSCYRSVRNTCTHLYMFNNTNQAVKHLHPYWFRRITNYVHKFILNIKLKICIQLQEHWARFT